MKRIFSTTLFIIFFGLTNIAYAQTIPAQDNLQFIVTPEYPGPKEVVNIQIEDYTQNLNSLEISWFLDGKLQKRGVGDRKFQFTTGDLGSVSKISVSSSAFSKEINVRPTGLDIVWQTKSYTPPFYKGKALYTYQSLVDFVAMPSFMTSSGAMIDPKTLVYKWTRNGSVLGDSSGYGKNVFSTSGGVLAKPLQVEVEASTIDGSMRAKKSIELQGAQPEVFLYENHPLYGILYNKAIGPQFDLKSKEISLSSAPYFFDVNRKDDPALTYNWSMNGKKLSNQKNPDSLVLRKPDNTQSGSALVGVNIQKIGRSLQFRDFSTKIRFEVSDENIPTI